MIAMKFLKDRFFWIIFTLISTITMLHYSSIMAEWEFHLLYRRLYYFPIILASFKYRLKGGVFTTIIISLLYIPHLWINTENMVLSFTNQILEIIMFISIGFITGKLVEKDYNKQVILENKIIEITKLQNYTRSILNSINNGVISIDNDFNITSVNKEGKRILKYYDKNLVKVTEIITDSKFIDALNEVKTKKKTVFSLELKLNHYDDNYYLKLKILPLTDVLDNVMGLVVVIEDLTDKKFYEAQAERNDRLGIVGELASGIAHEIRNPLGIIKTISQVFQKKVKDKEIEEGLNIIVREIDRANKIIKSLLEFAKPAENINQFISLNLLIEDVILITKQFVEKQNIIINFKMKKDILIKVDEEKIKQVFVNLIFNSVQAMKTGGEIDISFKCYEKWLKVSFKDTGIGISKENVNKVFNPFFTTKDEGTGLGLSISDRIIQDHNGYFEIDSDVGKGTCMNIFLPLHDKEGDIIV